MKTLTGAYLKRNPVGPAHMCRSKILRLLPIPLLAVWLAIWLAISWPGVQDDALIHLRYASFLNTRHFITFDGVHPSFGASSLLYVGLLALLRSLTKSPLLSRRGFPRSRI